MKLCACFNFRALLGRSGQGAGVGVGMLKGARDSNISKCSMFEFLRLPQNMFSKMIRAVFRTVERSLVSPMIKDVGFGAHGHVQ